MRCMNEPIAEVVAVYRKPVLRGDLALKLRSLIREICCAMDFEILRGNIRPGIMFIFCWPPQKYSPSRVMKAIRHCTICCKTMIATVQKTHIKNDSVPVLPSPGYKYLTASTSS